MIIIIFDEMEETEHKLVVLVAAAVQVLLFLAILESCGWLLLLLPLSFHEKLLEVRIALARFSSESQCVSHKSFFLSKAQRKEKVC